jgi:arsenite-transporting ATPase
VLQTGARLRFVREGAELRLELPLPHAEPGGLEVSKRDDELWIATGAQRRSVKLPRPLARASLATARLAAGTLVVRFRPAGAS